MKKELLVKTVADAISNGIEAHYDGIIRDMERQFQEGDPDKAFKFPVTVKLTLKPAGDKSKVGVDMLWNNPRKVSLGDYVMDESGQGDLFNQDFGEADDDPKQIEEKTIGVEPHIPDSPEPAIQIDEKADEFVVSVGPVPEFDNHPQKNDEPEIPFEIDPGKKEEPDGGDMFKDAESQRRYNEFLGKDRELP